MLSTMALVLMLSSETFAQFKERGPKGDQMRYNAWVQKKHSFNGFKLNRGQRNALGLSNGFLGTGIGANKSRKKKTKTKLSKADIQAIRERNQSNTINP